MDYKTFLHKIVMEMPREAYNAGISVVEECDEQTKDVQCYKIVDVSNDGDKDWVTIFVKKIS